MACLVEGLRGVHVRHKVLQPLIALAAFPVPAEYDAPADAPHFKTEEKLVKSYKPCFSSLE